MKKGRMVMALDASIVNELKKAVRDRLPAIKENADWLLRHPETGFKEYETQAHCVEILAKHGFKAKTFSDVTGFTCMYDTGKPGPSIMLMGEMDALINRDHPFCNPQTGAAHACGHFIQVATTMGAFLTLTEGGFMDEVGGKLMLMGVPAEECIEQEWRLGEIKKGRLHFLGGKPELMYRGAFDDADLVIGMHAGFCNDGKIAAFGTHNGFMVESVTFKGRSAHAAGSPEKGINALYMVNTALTALNGLRETFRDEDRVRVHPIVTSAGSVPNVIPEEAHMECQCRANNMEAVYAADAKFERAVGAGAYAFGGKAVIRKQPGYLPYRPTPEFDDIAVSVADEVLGKGRGTKADPVAGSEDLGDLNSVMPAMMVFTNYMNGYPHSADYVVANPQIYEDTVLFLSALALTLAADGGRLAKKVMTSHKPLFNSMKAYCDTVSKLFTEKTVP
jgi:amidohydrolase